MNEYLMDMLCDVSTVEYIDTMKAIKKATNRRKEYVNDLCESEEVNYEVQ